MDLEQAFRHALDGDALLFLGAGFSLGAVNRRKKKFPLSTDLSEHLMTALGETEPVPLQIASELYSQRHGEVGLLDFVNQELGVDSIAAHHVALARPMWRRVYSTNYDEVFEVAARTAGRNVRTLTLTKEIPSTVKGQLDCVHINGFLPYANAQSLHSSALVLSETAYLTARFVDSVWASLLRSDIEAARAVIFIGYSLADLDIGRAIVAIESVKNKCVFIVGPNAKLALRTTLEKFGSISTVVGVEQAAAMLESVSATHTPKPQVVQFSSFLQPKDMDTSNATPRAQDIFDLYVKGDIDSGLLARSLSEPNPFYAVRRSEIDSVVDTFNRGAPAVILLSRLANGKSTLAELIAAKLAGHFDVYIFRKETASLADEIRALRAVERPTVIVIDDYQKRIELIRELRLNASANQFLLLTSRTPTHLTRRDILQGILGATLPVEYRIDSLRERELLELDSILKSAGLLAGVAGWSQERRLRELYREKAESEFGGILLWLLESPRIRERLEASFAALKDKDEAQKVVIAAMTLTHIGQLPDIDDIAEFIGATSINNVIFSEDHNVADFIRYNSRTAYPRSSLFAAATLRALWEQGDVPKVLELILVRAWALRHKHNRFRMIARDLMRYSMLRRIVPTQDAPNHVQRYYDQIRNLPPCANNELFWLQFSLAEIERKQFDLADRHLTTSYKIAEKMRGYDTYQLDNVKALFLLTREIEEQDRDRSFRSFVDASRIINRQMRDRRHTYYPYRVASKYGEFWRCVACDWDADQKSVFIGACQNILTAAKGADADLDAMDDVINCKEIVKRTLIEAGVQTTG